MQSVVSRPSTRLDPPVPCCGLIGAARPLSRASKRHGETVAPALSQVLVNERDKRFAAALRKAADLNGVDAGGRSVVVGIFGLVHIDGIAELVR